MMYRCLKEDLIYFENCVDFTFLLLRTRAIGRRHEEKSFFSQSTRFWNKHHKIIIEPSEVKLHTDISKKLNLVGTKFTFFDFSTKVSTFIKSKF